MFVNIYSDSYVGHVDPSSASASRGRSQQTVFLIPMDKRIPKIRIRTRQASELLGKRIVVAIDSWDRASRYPVGHFVRSLGELETKEAETEALLLEYDVQYRPFPKAVLDCLPKEGHDWKVPKISTTQDGSGEKITGVYLYAVSILLAVKTSTTHSTQNYFPTETMRSACILPMLHILLSPTTQWMMKLQPEGPQFTLSINVSTCCPCYSEQTYVH